jgi:hypothetical protein
MKKYFIILITAATLSTSLYAGTTHFPETRAWGISSAGMLYMYWNDAEFPQHFRLYVNNTWKNKPADQVTLTCNGDKVTAVAGDWTSCEVAPHKPVSFTITKANFKNGAAGVSERSY